MIRGVLLSALAAVFTATSLHAQYPLFQINPWKKIIAGPYFARTMCSLGDINGDGGNDFAAATDTDTTFIFYGGAVLDDEPDGYVLGGGRQVKAGDFNGDGLTDIVTSLYTIISPYNGRVRVYLHRPLPEIYRVQPDIVIESKRGGYTHGNTIKIGDYNGDGYDDILLSSPDEWKDVNGGAYLYFGGPEMDSIPDAVFHDRRTPTPGFIRGPYGSVIESGDFNGDGIDDFIIGGREYKLVVGTHYYNYEIYFGNREGRFDRPDTDVSSKDYPYMDNSVYAISITVDGKTDFCFAMPTGAKHFSLLWGKTRKLLSFDRPDAIFPKPFPQSSRIDYASIADQLYDLNGDTIYDYKITWKDIYNDQLRLIYKGSTIFTGVPVAQYHTSILYNGTPYPLKDIDGDGVDDFALCDGGPQPYSAWGVLIYRGDRRIATGVTPPPPVPSSGEIQVYPHPVSGAATVTANLDRPGLVSVELYDALGRKAKTIFRGWRKGGEQSFALRVKGLPAGAYMLVVRTERSFLKRMVIIDG